MNRQPSRPKYIKKEESDLSLVKWAAILMAGIFFLFYSFRTGLFNGYDYSFEKKLTGAALYSIVLILVMAIHLFKVWKDKSWKSVLSIAIWLLPLSFALSSIHAVSENYAHIMTMISCLLTGFFVFGLYFNDNKYTRFALETILMGSSYVLVWFGIINLFGQHWYPDALWFQLGSYRMTSVFQYPNTYAALLIAVLLASTYYVTQAKKRIWKSVHAFMLVPVFISFMLTYSRAALVIIPVSILFTLPFFKVAKQIMYILYLAVTVIISFAVLSPIENKAFSIAQQVLRFNERGTQIPPEKLMSIWSSEPLAGWGLLIGASIVVTAICLIMARWVEPWMERRLASFSESRISYLAAPGIMLVLAVAGAALIFSSSAVRGLLPSNLADRLENISFNQHSVLERGTFYENGFKIASDYPLFGSGGGGWSSLYQKYQTNPYTSNQAHSYFIQTLVETGWVGLLLHAAFFLLVLWLFIRSWIRHPDKRGSQLVYYIFAVSILLHSFIDFDMSYITIAAIVFFSLGSMLGSYDRELDLSGFTLKRIPLNRIYPAALAIFSIGLGIFTYRTYASYVQFEKAQNMAAEQKSIDQLFVQLDKAIALSPANSQFQLVKADWLMQVYSQTKNADYLNQAEKTLQKAQLLDGYSRQIIQAEYNSKLASGNVAGAIAVSEDAIVKFPWDISVYEMGIRQYANLGLTEKNAGNPDFQNKWQRAQKLHQDIGAKMEELKNLPKEQLQGRSFELTTAIRQSIGLILYHTQKYSEALNMLKPSIGDSLTPINDTQAAAGQAADSRTAVRYYLASLQKLGQEDAGLKEKLIQADSNEQNLLKELLEQSS